MDKNNKFHIDYCFLSEDYVLENVKIGTIDEWENNLLSDHCPIMVEVKKN